MFRMPLTRRALHRAIDTSRVEEAIRHAESRTSGEIRVSVAPLFWGDVRKTAEKAFERLGLGNTAERNGVLVFIVPARRRFVILGDAGIHEKVGQDFWEGCASALSESFRAGDFTGGLVAGIERLGDVLAAHFPRKADDRNELPDTVDFGERDPSRP